MSTDQTQDLLSRLAKIEGHMRAIRQMIEANRSCPDVLLQIAAVRCAVNKVAKILVKEYAQQNLIDATRSGNLEEEIARLRSALDSLIRSRR
ncbi:MAG: metal-sensing transcriptional repressor [Coleofasciculaceae cyanobacterium]